MTFSQNKSFKYIFFIFFGIILGYIGSGYISALESRIFIENWNSGYKTNEDIFLSEKVKKTMWIIRKYSYWFDKKTTTEIEDSVLKSIVNWLWDKHSTYFTKKETSEFEEALRWDFEWIGAVINDNPRGIKIMKIIPGSPAEKAGLMAWDIMTRVGDVSILGKTVEEAVKVIRWPKGTVAKITYKRWDSNTDLYIDVTRDRVSVPSVGEKMLENKIGYIEIATFGEHTTKEFIKSWNNLSQSGAQGIILDFRNNWWGYLDTAVDLASFVLPEKSPVVIIKQNNPNKNEILFTKNTVKNNSTIPILVLINDYSASASEIFAGAIQDHKRWIILWDKSYGKWSVQEPFDLGDDSIIKITTARWYTPGDKSIDEKWILPDILVNLSNKDYENIFDRQLKAAEEIMKDQIVSKKSIPEIIEKYKSNNFLKLTK
jgi:carboxyl-terminal processing protease